MHKPRGALLTAEPRGTGLLSGPAAPRWPTLLRGMDKQIPMEAPTFPPLSCPFACPTTSLCLFCSASCWGFLCPGITLTSSDQIWIWHLYPSVCLGLWALFPGLGILPLPLSLRPSVPCFLCLCADVGISAPLSVKGPCFPSHNYFFLWTPHFSDLEMNLTICRMKLGIW